MTKAQKTNIIKSLSLAGILGGILLLMGDWLFYFDYTSGADFKASQIMRSFTDTRLAIGGAVGPMAALLYCLGAVSIYYALKNVNQLMALLISSSLIISFAYMGAYHALYPMHGFIAKIQDPQVAITLKNQLAILTSIIYNIEFAVGLLATLLFFFLVLAKKTIYPKWIVFFFPTVLSLLSDLPRLLPYPIGGIILGRWDNGCFIVFFCLNVFYLWKLKPENLST
jgi:hypothetical protein